MHDESKRVITLCMLASMQPCAVPQSFCLKLVRYRQITLDGKLMTGEVKLRTVNTCQLLLCVGVVVLARVAAQVSGLALVQERERRQKTPPSRTRQELTIS